MRTKKRRLELRRQAKVLVAREADKKAGEVAQQQQDKPASAPDKG